MTSRRNFIKVAATSVITLPVIATATQPTLVDPETNPVAKNLFYVKNAADTDNAAYQAGSKCANCALYSGNPEAETGPCAIFSNNLVYSQGWCVAWAKKG